MSAFADWLGGGGRIEPVIATQSFSIHPVPSPKMGRVREGVDGRETFEISNRVSYFG
jgi:hypothetical protein